MPGAFLSRSHIALVALVLPILAMIGLFAWAGSQKAASPETVVTSFITAFNSGDCATMTAELYQAPGSSVPTCRQLVGNGSERLESCGLTVVQKGAQSSVTDTAPAGYSAPEVVRASCSEETISNGKKKSQLADFDFLVATNPNGVQQIVTLQRAPN